MFMYVPSKFGNSGIMMITLNFLFLAWALEMRSLRASANLFLTPSSGREEMKNWFCVYNHMKAWNILFVTYASIMTLYHMYLFTLG